MEMAFLQSAGRLVHLIHCFQLRPVQHLSRFDFIAGKFHSGRL
ncbi:MAG: hypothetical protein JWR09_4915 [Mucilaginibacter sp.]|nr:hypothetical protein [Mucilaginibacter sp.]